MTRAKPAAVAQPAKSRAPLVLARVSGDPRPTLTPQTFVDTMRAADAYQRIAESGGWSTLPVGTILKNGDKGAPVSLLRQRLAATGDLPPEAVTGVLFDAAVVAGVKRFQARHGLPETGVVRQKTVEALNVPAATRARQLAVSAQRLIGSAFAFGDRYVVVNIPAATVEAVEKGAVARRYVAVVGKADRPSPTVETRVTSINFNPTWTVPTSLIKKDIIPHMRKDAAYLAKMKIRILDGQGHEVEPTRIDWSTEKAVNFTLRQDAGAENSLGQVRIDMPNKHAVYMHDTPTKRLFAQDARFHSSGCVRVADVKAFVGWLLEGTPGPVAGLAEPSGVPGAASVPTVAGAWSPGDIDAAIAGAKRQDVRLAKAVPVAWVYMTGYATPDGTAHFRDDVYSLDGGQRAPAAQPSIEDLITSSITPGRKP